MYFPKGTRTENNPKFMKFYTMHKSMMRRCYAETSSGYSTYGAKGVTVSDDWKNLDDFFETIEHVEGYDYERIMAGELQLDKDIKYKGNKLYSKDTCMFVTAQENSGNKPNVMKPFVAVKPDYTYEVHLNREKFCRDNEMSTWTVFNILETGKGSYKGWQFFYEENFTVDCIVKRSKYVAISPEGKKYTYESHAKFARVHGLSAPNISMVISGKQRHHKHWRFYREVDFKEEYLNETTEVTYEALTPEGEVLFFKNITEFSREHSLSGSNISNVIHNRQSNHKGWKFKIKE